MGVTHAAGSKDGLVNQPLGGRGDGQRAFVPDRRCERGGEIIDISPILREPGLWCARAHSCCRMKSSPTSGAGFDGSGGADALGAGDFHEPMRTRMGLAWRTKSLRGSEGYSRTASVFVRERIHRSSGVAGGRA